MGLFTLTMLFGGREVNAAKRGFMLAVNNPSQIRTDLSQLASLKATMVRFPIYLHNQTTLDGPLSCLDAALPICQSNGITIVVDFHHPTRGVWGSQIKDADQFVRDWRTIASRVTSYNGDLWYDLANEQQDTAAWTWRALAQRTATEIRKIDGRHPIVFSAKGTTTSPATSISTLPGISNQILEFHFWNWTNVQFDGVAYPSTSRSKADMERLLSEVKDAGRRNGCPVYIGEVGIRSDHPNAARFLRDFTAAVDREGIHCTVHAFREAPIWNYEGTPAWSELTRWLTR
jgi:hypothetical protein